MAPDALNILMETIIPNKKGSKEIASDTPSLPPSTNFHKLGLVYKYHIVKQINDEGNNVITYLNDHTQVSLVYDNKITID